MAFTNNIGIWKGCWILQKYLPSSQNSFHSRKTRRQLSPKILFLGHPVIRIIPASNYCTMLSNISFLILLARRRTLGRARDVTRVRLMTGPMSNRRVRGRSARLPARPINNIGVRVRRVCSKLRGCTCSEFINRRFQQVSSIISWLLRWEQVVKF